MFEYLLRVRYSECDAQKIVFNARYADYIDLATTEFVRAVLGGVVPEEIGFDYRVAKLQIEWKAAARFDEVLRIRVAVPRTGASSFSVQSVVERFSDARILATGETSLVRVDPVTGIRVALGDLAGQLKAGITLVVDHAAALAPAAR